MSYRNDRGPLGDRAEADYEPGPYVGDSGPGPSRSGGRGRSGPGRERLNGHVHDERGYEADRPPRGHCGPGAEDRAPGPRQADDGHSRSRWHDADPSASRGRGRGRDSGRYGGDYLDGPGGRGGYGQPGGRGRDGGRPRGGHSQGRYGPPEPDDQGFDGGRGRGRGRGRAFSDFDGGRGDFGGHRGHGFRGGFDGDRGEFGGRRGGRGGFHGEFHRGRGDFGGGRGRGLGRGGPGRGGPEGGPDSRPRLQINYTFNSSPETLVCVPTKDPVLLFKNYTNIKYVHIKSERAYLSLCRGVVPPPLEEMLVLTADGDFEDLVHLVGKRVKPRLQDMACTETNANVFLGGKIVVRLGRQLFYDKRGGFEEREYGVEEVNTGLWQRVLGTTYEVSIPPKIQGRLLQSLQDQGLAQRPVRTSTKWKLHLLPRGMRQEIVVSAVTNASRGCLEMRAVKSSQVRHVNLDLVRPGSKLDLRLQCNAKHVEADADPGLQDFVNGMQLLDDNTTLLDAPPSDTFRLRRARKIKKNVYECGPDQWSFVEMDVQNYDPAEGDFDIKKMLMVEAQHLPWRRALQHMYESDDAQARRELPGLVARELPAFMHRVWAVADFHPPYGA